MANRDIPNEPTGHTLHEEGEYEQPPLVHTMGIVRWSILGALTLFALVMFLGHFGLAPWASAGAGAAQHHCPMHPTYISSQPGDCPICGMSLVQIKEASLPSDDHSDHDPASHREHSGAVSARPGQYICPMCPEIVSDTLARCPTCGMWLEQVAEVGSKFICPMHPEVVSDTLGRCPDCGMWLEPVAGAQASMQYTCPMHPEVISEEPGRCPICNMFLEPMTSPKHAHDATSVSTVPGLVPVTIEPRRLQLIGVKTAKAKRQSLGEKLQLVGYITADETKVSNLHVRVSGWVQQLYINETGQRVDQGQPLLTLYSPDLYQAQQDFLVARQGALRSNTDTALVALRNQLVAAARERLQLLGMSSTEIEMLEKRGEVQADLTLRSPFGGVVLEKGVFEGQFVGPDQTLFTIADLRTLWLLAEVYERDLYFVRRGQSVRITTASHRGEVFTGKVDFIYPTVDDRTRTVKLRIVLQNPALRLRPGMYAQAAALGDASPVLAVPTDAVMDGGETQYVFIVHSGTHFEPRLITPGRYSDDWVEVLAGLKEGEEVVTSANFLIDSESRLKAAIAGMGGTQADPHAGH